MKQRVRTGLRGLLWFLGLLGLLLGLVRLAQEERGQEVYAQAVALAGAPVPTARSEPPTSSATPAPSVVPSAEPSSEPQPTPTPTPTQDPYAQALQNMDVTALKAVNPDVLGWLWIPGTKLSYPLLCGEDNSFYLTHNWLGEASSLGSIFLEQANEADFSQFNTILYGHRMKNGSMFATLAHYRSAQYAAEHPRLYLIDETEQHCYEVFSAFEASVSDPVYQIDFQTTEEQAAFLAACLQASVLDLGIVPTVKDHILTLSTCSGRGYETRWVVQAVRREDSG